MLRDRPSTLASVSVLAPHATRAAALKHGQGIRWDRCSVLVKEEGRMDITYISNTLSWDRCSVLMEREAVRERGREAQRER